MKKFDIKPFREFWQDCFNCIVYSITEYTQNVPKLYYYNNMYSYITTDESTSENKKEYMSLTPWTDNFRLMDELTNNRTKLELNSNSSVIDEIIKCIDEDKIVLLMIDLFYWIDEGLHYLHNHINHYSMVIGYDEEREELIVLETGDDMYAEFRVPYERVIKSIHAAGDAVYSYEINENADVKMFNKEDISFYATQVIESIDDIVNQKDRLLNVEGFDENDLSDVLNIIQTHMFSMQNRALINSYMFENAFLNDFIDEVSLHEEFKNSANEFEKLKGACIKAQYRNNKYSEVERIRNKVFELLGKEKSLWRIYIDNHEKLEMKEIFI